MRVAKVMAGWVQVLLKEEIQITYFEESLELKDLGSKGRY